ncbi:MAG: SpoIID/LytB domain-containing protein [Candidatus Cellulosilyticum pullistercoris]|uniref:SpoIID/LytB domain-containing protein n=1 Tax=Candidatus Cellulosilyticum pullistercoris TaxID=2838521 RepID=A0A9E2KEI8_9FIRM|nr:SpoIID/LytB domain-containing protein [Candidatus Cellulosilyticum pullistercoris]
MKKFIQMMICVGSSMFLLPIFIVYISGVEVGHVGEINSASQTQVKKEEDIIDEEILVGILAKEIPYTYELEAIKTQAVLIRSYMARRILGIQNKGAIVGYTVDEMKQVWGEERYQSIYNVYKEAIEATRGEIILYDNQPIEALYHEASSGRTRDAKSVYKIEIPYLKGVESPVDKISKQAKYTKEEIVRLMKEKYPNLIASADALEKQIQIVSKDEAGYVGVIQIGNITLTGEEIKNMLELPSCAFKIYNSEESLIFDVKGVGTGVGLSQNGANELAKQGMGYEDIIKYYYTDVTIEKYEVQK